MTPIVIRPSYLSMWNDCSRRGASRLFRGILKDSFNFNSRTRNIIATSIGKAAHSGCMYGAKKMSEGWTPNLSEQTDAGIQMLHEEVSAGMDYDAKTSNLGTAEKQVCSYIKSYSAGILPTLEPIAVEKAIEAEIAPGVTVAGTPDIRDAKGIIDVKTGIHAYGHEAQLGCYSILSSMKGYCSRPEVTIHHAPRNKIQFSIINLDPKVCQTLARHVVGLIIDQWKLFETTGDPNVFPANPASMLCSEKYCQAWGTEWCAFGRKKG